MELYEAFVMSYDVENASDISMPGVVRDDLPIVDVTAASELQRSRLTISRPSRIPSSHDALFRLPGWEASGAVSRCLQLIGNWEPPTKSAGGRVTYHTTMFSWFSWIVW